MKSSFLTIISLIFTITPFMVLSQIQGENFPFKNIDYINSKDGLQGNEVYWIMQDRRGFIWIVTETGLNRYDGYSIRFFEFRTDKSNPFFTCQYWGVREDENGILWIPTTTQGLISFDPALEKFTQYRNQKNNLNTISDDQLFALEPYPGGSLWIATISQGLDKMDTRKKTFTHFVHRKNDSTSISDSSIFCLVPDEKYKHLLWVINSRRDFECFNTLTGKVIRRYKYSLPDSLCPWPEGGASMNIEKMKNGIIWIGSNDKGIYGFNTHTGKYIYIRMNAECKKSRHIWGMYFVLEDHAGNLWTTNDNNEIVYYNRTTNKFYFYPIEENSIAFIDNPAILFEDASGKIWISSTNGIVTVDTKQKMFFACRNDKNNSSSISGNLVNAMYRTRQGQFLVSSDNIDMFDVKTKTFTPLPLIADGKILDSYNTWNILEDDYGTIWFSCANGIISYNPVTNKSQLHSTFIDKIKVTENNSGAIVRDKQGINWTGNWNGGLCSFDPSTGKLQFYPIKENKDSSRASFNGPVYIDSRGIIYAFGWDRGFITFNPANETYKIFHKDAGNPSSVNNENCHSYIESRNGMIWFGTIGGGIGVFNPEMEKFKAFTTKDGLPHNLIVNITEDKRGDYWVSTYKGLSCFTPPANPFAPGCKIDFRNYDESDGIASNTLNKISSYCDTDGTMYFGTRGGGMFYFHPDDIYENDFIPPVQITDFKLLNNPVALNESNDILKSSIAYTKELSLNYRQNTVSFSFAALSFICPEENKYAYMLEGFDTEWIYTDASNRTATYTNLDAGEYTFKVKGSNNDGIWNEKATELKISITPPYWQTSWFKILIAVSIISIAYTFYRYRIGQILLLQRIRNKIAADLHDDIGSTLNSISIFSEVARKDEQKRDYSLRMIGESSRKIVDSMSDIVWSINPENDTFDKIIFRMRSLTYNLLKAKQIECDFASDDSLNSIRLTMEVRRNFYLIFKEALNNLIKYSQADYASVLVSHQQGSITCIVRDNGIGFDSTKNYDGNGLVNMKKRAEEIDALLLIDSELGKGTSVEITLKI